MSGLLNPIVHGNMVDMIIIRFDNPETEKRALGLLAGRFSFKSWVSGETMVPEDALVFLAHEGIRFLVEGPPTYERYISTLRNPAPAQVQ